MTTIVKIVKFQGQYLGCLDKVIIMSVLAKPLKALSGQP
jgi:hypothetical protein